MQFYRTVARQSVLQVCLVAGLFGTTAPNIVVIMVDDAGYADFGFHGSEEILTPNLDALAAESVRFSQAYATAPQCTPSRAAFLTGRYAQRFGFETNYWPNIHAATAGLPQEELTIAELLAPQGYRSGLIGKWHLGHNVNLYHPLDHGFDEFFGFRDGAATYFPPEGQTHPEILRGREDAGETRYLTDAFADEAINFIERNADDPFFLFVSFNAPHGPLDAPDYLLNLYSFLSEDQERQVYAAAMTGIDIAVGRISKALADEGIAETTMVFFTSDHGGSPGKDASNNGIFQGGKQTLHEGGIRVPLLLRWPSGVLGPRTVDFPVSLLDIAQTACIAAGLPESETLDGIDLIPYLNGSIQGAPERVLFWRFRWPPDVVSQQTIAVRDGDWKYLDTRYEAPALYNIDADSNESEDRIAEFETMADSLFGMFKQWERDALVEPAFYRPYFGSPLIPDQDLEITMPTNGAAHLTIKTEKEHFYRLFSSADLQTWQDTGVRVYGDQSKKEIIIPGSQSNKFFKFEYSLYDGEIVSNPEDTEVRQIYED